MTEPSPSSPFQGNAVLLWLRHHPAQWPGGIAIEYPELRTVGDRLFLSGRGPSAQHSEWNVPHLLAWSDVALMLTFATRAELLQAMGTGEHGVFSRLAWAVRGPHS